MNFDAIYENVKDKLYITGEYLHKGYDIAKENLGKLGNHTVTFIKSVPARVQDPRLAYASIVGVTLVAFQVSAFVTPRFAAYLESKQYEKETAHGLAGVLGIGIVIASVSGFNYWTKLPINPLVILGVSTATILVRTSHSFFTTGKP